MRPGKFVQIHTLTSYPATLLNRDDAGFAKRLPFGGATRTRISSQCLKYHWRHHQGNQALTDLDVAPTVRSRQTFDRLIAQPLIKERYPERLVVCVVKTLMELVLSGKKTTDSALQAILKQEEGLASLLHSTQVTILGEPEVRYLLDLTKQVLDELRENLPDLWTDPASNLAEGQTKAVIDVCKQLSDKELKKNLQGLGHATGLDAALFGRMATSDLLARGDAAIHVAHAFTTHEEESENDYFSAVDELVASSDDGELGSGHINTSELASGLFYGYVVVDVPLLVSNLEGCLRTEWENADRNLAASVVERLIHIIATVSPGAKLGSTAPYAHSELVLVEVGASQPRTLANAFRNPVERKADLLTNTYKQLARHLEELDVMYDSKEDRRLSAVGPVELLTGGVGVDKTVPLAEAAAWAASQVRG